MAHPMITKETFDFLNDLQRNNDREWFGKHKDRFLKEAERTKRTFVAVQGKMAAHDAIEKLKIFRIYRDVRFSNDKSPYKTHFSASLVRAGAQLRGGYYIHIQPKGSFIAVGFWNPDKGDLLRIRREWEVDATEIRKIMRQEKFRNTWGTFSGDTLKTAPKGFDRGHANIDLIRRKQYLFIKNFTDREVLGAGFADRVDEAFRHARPFLDLMSVVLTTDLNGESILR